MQVPIFQAMNQQEPENISMSFDATQRTGVTQVTK